MSDGRDGELDIVVGDDCGRADEGERRRWLGIHFECCNGYARIYKNRDGTAYVGCCPHCAAPVRVPIGPGGSNDRFFRAT